MAGRSEPLGVRNCGKVHPSMPPQDKCSLWKRRPDWERMQKRRLNKRDTALGPTGLIPRPSYVRQADTEAGLLKGACVRSPDAKSRKTSPCLRHIQQPIRGLVYGPSQQIGAAHPRRCRQLPLMVTVGHIAEQTRVHCRQPAPHHPGCSGGYPITRFSNRTDGAGAAWYHLGGHVPGSRDGNSSDARCGVAWEQQLVMPVAVSMSEQAKRGSWNKSYCHREPGSQQNRCTTWLSSLVRFKL